MVTTAKILSAIRSFHIGREKGIEVKARSSWETLSAWRNISLDVQMGVD